MFAVVICTVHATPLLFLSFAYTVCTCCFDVFFIVYSLDFHVICYHGLMFTMQVHLGDCEVHYLICILLDIEIVARCFDCCF